MPKPSKFLAKLEKKGKPVKSVQELEIQIQSGVDIRYVGTSDTSIT